jgi:P-type E1-E2 ATPase
MFVTALNLSGKIVGVTGRGVSDIHCLNSAKVGFSMGRSGCSAARDNSSLIVLDDNFNTIYNAIKWGSNIFENCRKFLQFQLTCNISCVMIVLIGSATVGASPFTVMQLLWINLLMDILGAIGLATEAPQNHTMHHREFRKDNKEITPTMRL